MGQDDADERPPALIPSERSRLIWRAAGMVDAAYELDARADRCSNKSAAVVLRSAADDIRTKAAAERDVAKTIHDSSAPPAPAPGEAQHSSDGGGESRPAPIGPQASAQHRSQELSGEAGVAPGPSEAPSQPAAVREALFPADIVEDGGKRITTLDASYNLQGALYDIKRFAAKSKPADAVCIQTIQRVIEQLERARAALTNEGGAK